MEYTQESLRELAERIYDLDAEVYTRLGSSLGRVTTRLLLFQYAKCLNRTHSKMQSQN